MKLLAKEDCDKTILKSLKIKRELLIWTTSFGSKMQDYDSFGEDDVLLLLLFLWLLAHSGLISLLLTEDLLFPD